MNPKISIIVPVYKVEPYIHKCIDSILAQTFTDFELILIDDGSPDRCGEICDEYANNDNRVKVIHKENGGVSEARNSGIDRAVGEYIIFVDSDDWIESYSLQMLNENISDPKIDVVIFGLVKDIHSKNKLIKSESNGFYKKINLNITELSNNFIYFLNSVGMHPSWMYLFKAKIIKNFNLYFNSDLVLYEDFDFNLRYLMNCNKITLLPDALYHYNLYVSVDLLAKRNKINIISDISTVCTSLFDFLKNTVGKKDIEKQVLEYILPIYTLCFRNIVIHRNKSDLAYKIIMMKQIKKDLVFNILIQQYGYSLKFYRILGSLLNKNLYLAAYFLILVKFNK
ncbi:glycosyltransferase family 2 protein [Aquibacillus saliphilus]|uniref:glycosyltransferase family 2 protein n=1 Tax=Aquibacillus saliphilus TaxID=1909422 RepID=UPI001CF0CBE6|nr:glycosyltransferase family 2 protein [Aquibacillus saliphilus]